MKFSTTLSKISNVVSVIPKPPLSLLRLGGMTNPVGAGMVVGSVVAVKAFEHRGEIKSTLGNIVNRAKSIGSKVVSTIDTKESKNKEDDENDFPLVPILLVGGGLIVLFVVMKKRLFFPK